MTLRKTVKKNARGCLHGMWGRAALILLVIIAVEAGFQLIDTGIFRALGFENIPHSVSPEEIISGGAALAESVTAGQIIISVVMQLLRLVVLVPLMLGVTDWALALTDGKRLPVGHIFWAYDNKAFGRSIGLTVVVGIKTALFGLLVSLPGIALVTCGTLLPANGSVSEAAGNWMGAAGGLLLLGAFVIEIWFAARYFLTQLLLCDRYYYKVNEAVRISVKATKGLRWQIVGFELSFLPWILLLVFIFPAFYVLPYLTVASVLYARFLFEDHLMRSKQLDLSRPENLVVDDLAPERYEDARTDAGLSPESPEAAPADSAPAPAGEPAGEPSPEPAAPETKVETFTWTPPAPEPPAAEKPSRPDDIADL